MSASCLTRVPPELKLLIYSECHPHDLLSISHVSQFWRYLVLNDKRWNEWFALISNESEGTAEAFFSRYKILNSIPKRTIVTLCFYNQCVECSAYTTDIFLPLLKRVCVKCRRDKKYAVISLSSALMTYDLKEKDLNDVLILHWEETDPTVKSRLGVFYRARLMSESIVKEIAIRKHGSEANLATQLERKKAAARTAYEKRVAAYDAAKRDADAEAVSAGKVKAKSRRPAIPALLKNSVTPPFFQNFALFQFGYLSVDSGDLSLRFQQLDYCRICFIMEKLRENTHNSLYPDSPYEWKDPGTIPLELIPSHQQDVHYSLGDAECENYCAEDHCEELCNVCLTHYAVEILQEIASDGESNQPEFK
ncbi:hypothetical protein C8R46DRAFT_1363037 [Mycena filopes]|nr:hypothetical protein C8R46DRAFT_1363037 [Mycena filopes]